VISHTDLNRSADIPIFRLWTRLCKILKSHGAVLIEQYRQAASYVDRITVGAHQRARPKPYTNYRADAAYNDHPLAGYTIDMHESKISEATSKPNKSPKAKKKAPRQRG
jgi:hypothetical protein